MTSTRVTSTAIFAVFFLTGLYWDPVSFIVPAVALFTAFVAAYEYCRLAQVRGHRPVLWVSWAVALALTLSGILSQQGLGAAVQPHTAMAVLAGALVLCGAVIVLRNRTDRAMADMGLTLFAGFYAGLPMGLLMAMHRAPRDPAEGDFLLLFLLSGAWMADSGAYFVGHRWGRVKLCPLISPKKTVEGLYGGIAATFVLAIALRLIPLHGREVVSWKDTLALAAIISIVSPLGDLAESVIKRDANVKDSGPDFTGHGGILDVVDSLLFVIPAAYLYFYAARPTLFF